MNQLSLVLVFAAGASICTAQAQSKVPTKAELALLTPPVTVVHPPSPLGGGSDDCLNAATQDAISGLGNFAADMTISTTGATPAPGCGNMTKDVWFEWTSTVTNTVTVQMCGNTTSDVMLAVWTGAGCPVGAATACNDDFCGLVSSLSFSATATTVYMIQVGMYANGTGVLTSIDISIPPPPPLHDDCATPLALAPGSGLHPLDTTAATTGAQGQFEALCSDYGQTAIAKDLWYTWTATMGGPVKVSTCGLMTLPTANADTRIAVYDGAGCPLGAAIACNDDQGLQNGVGSLTCAAGGFNSTADFTAVCGQTYTFQIGNYPLNLANNVGAFQVTENGTTTCTLGTGACFGTVATCPCTGPGGSAVANPGAAGHGCANTGIWGSGDGALLTASGIANEGFPTFSTDTVVLRCENMTGPGLFLQSNALVGPIVNFNDGGLCAAGGVIVRLGLAFPGGVNPPGVGVFPNPADPDPISKQSFNNVPSQPVLLSGAPTPETKHYQCWYRDIPTFCNPATHNMSNSVSFAWAP